MRPPSPRPEIRACAATRSPRLVALALLVALFPSAARTADEAGAAEPKTLGRTEEPIVITGSTVPDLHGWDERRIGVFALREGRMAPIPFQVDEKTSEGQWALAHGPETIPDDDDPPPATTRTGEGDSGGRERKSGRGRGRKEAPILDKSDEIVFMTGDSGDRASKRLWPEGWKVGAEVRIEAPTPGGGTGWVYLIGFDSEAPRSPVDYVRYDDETLRVYTQDFALGFSKTIPISWDYFTLSSGKEGEYLENRIDRLKIRAGATMLFGGIQILRNEEDFKSWLLGWNDGAVRVVRQVENSVNVFLGIQSPSGVFESLYYRNCVVVPTIVRLPFKPSLIFTDVILMGGIDFRDLKGWKAISSRNPTPVEIDGRMSDEEKAWDTGDTDWVVFYKDDLAFMSRFVVDGDLKIERRLYYRDDEMAPDPPEFFPGQVPQLLYDMRGWIDAPSGAHRFHTINYAIRGYRPGDESIYATTVDHPSRVTVGRGLED